MSLAIGDRPPIGGDDVTKQKAVVEKYTEVFRRGDGPNPELTLDRLVDEGDTVAAVGSTVFRWAAIHMHSSIRSSRLPMDS